MGYLRRDALLFGLLAAFAVIFAVVLTLAGAPADAVRYALLLCAVLAGCAAILNAVRAARRRGKLRQVLAQLPHSIDGLPKSADTLERDYQTVVRTLHEAYTGLDAQAGQWRIDMVDYYTLWAHQIKTPIAAMRLLLQSGDHPQNRELAAELFKIEQYADMVLQYLRLESESTDFVFARYDLDSIVRRAVRKYAPLFIRSRVALDYAPLSCTVLTDEKWLCFVIEQLLSNALKYTPTGTVTISLEGEVALVVADTGIGIAPEDLPRIFEKGFTGYNGRSDRKSTGIGLYLCRRILQKLGHGIDVQSEPGRGTCVRIDLASAHTRHE